MILAEGISLGGYWEIHNLWQCLRTICTCHPFGKKSIQNYATKICHQRYQWCCSVSSILKKKKWMLSISNTHGQLRKISVSWSLCYHTYLVTHLRLNSWDVFIWLFYILYLSPTFNRSIESNSLALFTSTVGWVLCSTSQWILHTWKGFQKLNTMKNDKGLLYSKKTIIQKDTCTQCSLKHCE